MAQVPFLLRNDGGSVQNDLEIPPSTVLEARPNVEKNESKRQFVELIKEDKKNQFEKLRKKGAGKGVGEWDSVARDALDQVMPVASLIAGGGHQRQGRHKRLEYGTHFLRSF